MNIWTIPVRNLNRKLLRTVLLVAVFSIGILSMVTLNRVSEVVGESLEKQMNQYGANILVYPVIDVLKVSYGGVELGSLSYDVEYLPESMVVNSIKNIELKKNISAVAPKLVIVERMQNSKPDLRPKENGQAKRVVFVGVDWEEEQKVKNHWVVDGAMPGGASEVLAGSTIAEFLALRPGDRVRVGGNKEFKVSGILQKTGSEDDSVVFMGLSRLQEISGMRDRINFVEVSALCSACPIEDIVMQIHEKLPDADIRTVQSVVKQRLSAIGFVQRLAGIVSAAIVLTASFMIALFMINSVNERKKEIGILRSMGYSKLKVFHIFCFEAVLIGLISGVIGYAAGYFSSFKVLGMLNVVKDAALLRFSPGRLLLTVLFVTLVSVCASIMPAWKAARIEPSDALVSL